MELFYRKQGIGPNLIILHGLFGSSDNWMSIGKMLEKDFTIWAIDQRNHGQSPHDEVFNYQAMSDDLDQFIRSHQIEDPFLIGHSMGGKTVMEYLTSGKAKAEKALIADIGPKQYPLHHQSILEGLHAVDLDKVKTRKDIENQLLPYIPEFGVRAFLMKNIYRTESGEYNWRINLPVITSEIANVGSPTGVGKSYDGEILFLRGEKSRYVLDEDIPGISKIFPKAEIQTLPEAGHWLHAEQPGEFVEVLKEYFLN